MIDALGYRDGQPIKLRLVWIGKDSSGRDTYLAESAAPAWVRMASAALADGVDLVINTAWRDHEWQQRLWDAWQKGLTHLRPCRPGYSRHEAGEAVDIDLIDDKGHERPAAAWLLARAHEFGFVHPIGREPWHHEYNPKAAAKVGVA